ncbi:unnamed protein product [Trifolium pratense]|uniref:Uncharacterized protein n=1 Tax=Trifolium pratense TaxID=57577 RepID=A0ACB0JM95_TRIPR|nr:unnamed protein product [Trifolium pratense]
MSYCFLPPHASIHPIIMLHISNYKVCMLIQAIDIHGLYMHSRFLRNCIHKVNYDIMSLLTSLPSQCQLSHYVMIILPIFLLAAILLHQFIHPYKASHEKCSLMVGIAYPKEVYISIFPNFLHLSNYFSLFFSLMRSLLSFISDSGSHRRPPPPENPKSTHPKTSFTQNLLLPLR